jgi:galactose mutarotase-like enzyme
MYWALLKGWVERWRRSIWRAAVMRSGLLTVLVLTLMLVGLAFGWREHRMGQFAQLKRELGNKPVHDATVKPGGQDIIQLQRSQMIGGNGPEFLSATLLPGRGMNLLQIKAYLPQKGEVNLLASPTPEEAGRMMTGTGPDAAGAMSLGMGAAIEAPWASRIYGVLTPDGQGLTAVWRGVHLVLPTDAKDSYGVGGAAAAGGLLLKQPSDTVSSSVMPDGGEAQATFHPGDFGGRWPSKTEISTTVAMSGRSIQIRITARNTGTTAEPIGIGWHPRFAILNGHRGQMMLRLPQGLRVEVKDRRTGQLSGKLLPVEGTEYDFTGHGGAKLGALNLDDSFVHLRTGLMENGPVAELRDPENDYGLRITAMTSTIRAIRVYAPLDGSFLSIEPQFNYDDPFGREWAKEEDTGMVVLQPGESTQWRIRLEIFSLSSGQTDHL